MLGGRLPCASAVAAFALTVVGSAAGASSLPVRVQPSHPLVTGVYMWPDDVETSSIAYDRVAAAGATVARLTLWWYAVAPKSEPADWTPSDPADPNYNWAAFDAVVQAAVAAGLQPLVTIMGAPAWAQMAPAVSPPNSRLPDPSAFAAFATAAATRYGGSFQGLPRVRYWQAWNEPNISLYLVPQLTNKQPVSPAWYRRMLNAFADAVHRVHSDNLVIAAGLAPFRDLTPDVLAQDSDWGPLSFMRALLCISPSLKPTCSTHVKFDVWAQHPYTSGGPTHHAVLPNDVSLGDLQKVRDVLAAAARYRHLAKPHPGLWVTEFSWDTNPPDPKGVPATLARRWVAEALYRMWSYGVSLVTWQQFHDDPMTTSFVQSGLYYRGASLAADRPKPLLAAFRFPVVGLPAAGGTFVWGRLPGDVRGRVEVEVRRGGAWRPLGLLTADRYGVFQHVYTVPYSGWVRARLVSGRIVSPPFALANVPDRFYNPFGQTTRLEPPKKRP